MSSDETMRLVATVVDGYSGPLKEMMNALKKISEGSKDIHAKGKKDVVDHTKTYRELGEQIRKVKDNGINVLTPSLAAMGVTIFGVSEGFGKLVEQLRGAGERWNMLNETMKRGGVTARYVDVYSRTFEKLGLDANKAADGVANVGEVFDKLKRGDPEEMGRLSGVFSNLLPYVGDLMKGAKDREEATDRMMRAITDASIPIDQRRKMAQAFGIDPALAAKSGKDFGEALRDSIQRELDHPLDMDLFKRLREAFAHLNAAQRDFGADMVNTFGPPGVKLVDGFASELEILGKKFRDPEMLALWNDISSGAKKIEETFKGLGINPSLKSDLQDIKSIIDGIKWLFDSKGKLSPGSVKESMQDRLKPFGLGSALDDKKTQENVKEGTRRGLEEFYQSLKQQNAQGGYTPMAYTPGGGGAVRGGYFGSKQFPAVDATGGGPFSKAQRDAISGGGATDSAGSGPTSGSLAEQRKRLAQELQSNPALREKVLRIAANEQGRNPQGTQAVIESMMNRAIVRGTSLEKQARWHRSEGGYYDEGNMGRGALENAKSRAVLEESLRSAISGGNLSNYATDNSSGSLAARERATGKFRFRSEYGGRGGTGSPGMETFFAPGWAEKGLARRWDEWAKQTMAGDHPRGARLRDMVRRGRSAPSDAELLKLGRRSDAGSALQGSLGVKIDLNGFPKGTRTAISQEGGLLKDVALRRGSSMPLASETS